MSRSTRLRGDLAREVAKQTARVMELMHSTGFVHGGSLTLSHHNALLKFPRSNVVKRPFSGGTKTLLFVRSGCLEQLILQPCLL